MDGSTDLEMTEATDTSYRQGHRPEPRPDSRSSEPPPRPDKLPLPPDPDSGPCQADQRKRNHDIRERHHMQIKPSMEVGGDGSHGQYSRQPQPARLSSSPDPIIGCGSEDGGGFYDSRNRELSLQSENRQLKRSLAAAKHRAEWAESGREAQEATDRQFMEQIANLKLENQRLRTELEDARSHIFSLQSYRKEVTPEDVGHDFDDLLERVNNFVERLLAPLLDDGEQLEEFSRKLQRPMASMLKQHIQAQPELHHAAHYQDTDVDIIVGLIMRCLMYDILGSSMTFSQPASRLLSVLENSMKEHVTPPKDAIAIRSWRADAVGALLVAPEFQGDKRTFAKSATERLARLLEIFSYGRSSFGELCGSIHDELIAPAMKLQETMQVAIHHYYLDMGQFIQMDQRHDFVMLPGFFNRVPQMDCINLVQNRKKFNLEKENASPTDLRLRMRHICSVTPALMMRQYGQGDSIKDAIVIRKQQCLVAWGSQEAREKATHGPRTVVGTLLLAKDRETFMTRMGLTS